MVEQISTILKELAPKYKRLDRCSGNYYILQVQTKNSKLDKMK